MEWLCCNEAALLSAGPMPLQAPYQIVLHNPSWGGVPNSWNVHVDEASAGLILGEQHCAAACYQADAPALRMCGCRLSTCIMLLQL